ncbi:MAG: hypothetical protein AB7O52_16110 [Planctomycetota bacterium]
MRKGKVLALVLAFGVTASTAVLACHSNYFDECFVKIQQLRDSGKLQKDQITAIWNLRDQFNTDKSLDHQNGLSCAAHDKHVPTFIAAAAGVLDDSQFKHVTGKEKTEVEKLRYELNQLKKELQQIRELLKDLKSS